MGRGLSELQRDILINALTVTEARDANDKRRWDTDERTRQIAASLGVTEWHPSLWGPHIWQVYGRRRFRNYFSSNKTDTWTRAQAADASRALARLERRGLVERQNDFKETGRTTCIKLTEAGRALAETLRANG